MSELTYRKTLASLMIEFIDAHLEWTERSTRAIATSPKAAAAAAMHERTSALLQELVERVLVLEASSQVLLQDSVDARRAQKASDAPARGAPEETDTVDHEFTDEALSRA